jgi:type 1 fimbria pilin
MVVGWLALSPVVQAKMDTTNIRVNVSGTVVANARCSFSGGNPITVEYGDVYISDIGGDTYRQPLAYGVSCRGDADGKTIQLQLSGTGADFDGTLLSTNAKGLGIKLLRDNSQMVLGRWYDLNPAAPPKLEGVLVKQSGARFSNGQAFSAAATLTVAYN